MGAALAKCHPAGCHPSSPPCQPPKGQLRDAREKNKFKQHKTRPRSLSEWHTSSTVNPNLPSNTTPGRSRSFSAVTLLQQSRRQRSTNGQGQKQYRQKQQIVFRAGDDEDDDALNGHVTSTVDVDEFRSSRYTSYRMSVRRKREKRRRKKQNKRTKALPKDTRGKGGGLHRRIVLGKIKEGREHKKYVIRITSASLNDFEFTELHQSPKASQSADQTRSMSLDTTTELVRNSHYEDEEEEEESEEENEEDEEGREKSEFDDSSSSEDTSSEESDADSRSETLVDVLDEDMVHVAEMSSNHMSKRMSNLP